MNSTSVKLKKTHKYTHICSNIKTIVYMSTIQVKILIEEIVTSHIFHTLQSSALSALGKHGAHAARAS